MKNPYRKPLGVALTLGGLLFLGLLATRMGPARQGFVWKDFKVLKGTYLGTVYRMGRTGLVLKTADGPMVLEMENSVTVKAYPGDAVEVQASCQDENHPRILRSEDIKFAPLAEEEGKIPLGKTSPGPWFVCQGWARNGSNRYRTELPDGEYDTLYGIKVGRRWLALE